MSRESGSEHPSQRTVAELLAEYGNSGQGGGHRRRRRAEDPTETAPQAIIERVLSDSGQMRAIRPDEEDPSRSAQQDSGPAQGGAAAAGPPQAGPANQPPPGKPQQPGPQPAQPRQPGPNAAAQAPPAQPPGPAPNQAPPAAGQQFGPSTGRQRVGPPPPQSPAGQNPVQQGPAAQHQPPPSPAPPMPAAAPEPSPAEGTEQSGADFWTARFTAAGAPPRTAQPDDPASPPAAADNEATLQHPAVSTGPWQTPPGPHQPPAEGATEQLPRVEAEARNTAMAGYPGAAQEAPVEDPYDYAYDEYGYEQGYQQSGYAEATYADASYADYPGGDYRDGDYADGGRGAVDYRADPYDADDEYDAALPAGMDADDYRPGSAARSSAVIEDEEPQRTTGKEWLLLAVQGGCGLVAGGAVWFAFRWLWMAIPIAALVAALVITGALVFVARKFLRTDDLQTILLAVLVGLICTVSPAALLLIGQ